MNKKEYKRRLKINLLEYKANKLKIKIDNLKYNKSISTRGE